ncbi:hydroxymethylglutaryl-CoA lyase [Lysinibacillus sp. BW-2-10]|uniref:hydroxymethylglutaryl-CoA lyase n=1 Tax=Lysinibacillus sp. BW-2-10 TaxID=2590030 RepID=UPI00117BF351|nr:hydroxymethylglutaryl-CoA lyase [Lysinibacillus sp. BW-2-10]TSI09302.1 hydroxymethylglutaryl-CoA lyase [Lysinibacillus sp. BW-2-10]
MTLPKKVEIYEVGPREGFQIEEQLIATEDKINFVNKISETGIANIEVTSFVNPKLVPNMVDAEEFLAKIERNSKIQYRTVYLNVKGLKRALEQNITLDGVISISASDIFARRNTNKSADQLLGTIPEWVGAYQQAGISVDQFAVMATFGCNFEGAISLEQVMSTVRKGKSILEDHGETLRKLKLCDTMGWANPEQIKRTVFAIKNEWPEIDIMLHLHDTRGLGCANAYAALQEGITEFESAIGGLGGCPFAAVKGAAGNIATEDFVFLCENLGIETGVDLPKLLECVELAENIVGRNLPGHLKSGGLALAKIV